MSDQNVSQTPSASRSNGKHENQPVQEANMKTPYTHAKEQGWVLEDFSQNKINRGQQSINYIVKDVNEKIVDTLKLLRDAVAKADSKIDLGPVNHAIDEVAALTSKIAGEFPPGCQDPL